MPAPNYYGIKGVRSREPELDVSLNRNESRIDHHANRLGLGFSSGTVDELPRIINEVFHAVLPNPLIFEGTAEIVLSRSTAQIQHLVSSFGLAFDDPDAAEITRHEAILELSVGILGLAFDSPAAIEITRNVAEVSHTANQLGLGFDTPTAVEIPRNLPRIDHSVSNLGLDFDLPAESSITRHESSIDHIASPVGLSFMDPTDLNLARHTSAIDHTAGNLGLTFSPTDTGTNVKLDGIDAYLYHVDPAYLDGVNSGSWWVWFKSDAPLGGGIEETLFAASNTETPRLEFGLRQAIGGDTEVYIESDNGDSIGGTTFWRVPFAGTLFDNQNHLILIQSNGSSYSVAVDGQFLSSGYGTDNGRWFGQVASDSGSPLTMVSAGAFRRNGTVSQFMYGELDEMVQSSHQFNSTELTQLWNAGNGWLIPQIESDWVPLWSTVSHAWELTNLEAKQFGREYLTGNQIWFVPVNVQQGSGGIVGAGT